MIDEKTASWFKRHAVALIACLAALASMAFVPPDSTYADYFDLRTLVCLFCAMAVVTALDNVGFILVLATRATQYFRSRRAMIAGFVFMTFFAAMFVSNDVALLTLLPLTYLALEATDSIRYLAFTFVLETAAANLGGMILPFGSPQNLFLFSFFEISTGDFIATMAIPFLVSTILISLMVFLVRSDRIKTVSVDVNLRPKPTALYLALFALTIAVILRALPIWAGAIVPAVLLFADRRALARLDWGLMVTFVAFFIFAGNVTRMDAIAGALESGLNDNVLLFSALASQVISNVPTAILFAQFTDNWRELLIGVNIGGVGTLVASLANLIALAKYREYHPGQTGRFVLTFTAVNALLLVVLCVAAALVVEAGLLGPG